MLKFTIYVLTAYALYYFIAIGYEILKSPKSKKEKKVTHYSVTGLDDEVTKEVPDVAMSQQASAAIEKKND